jgi:putative intracellular protease/amidase
MLSRRRHRVIWWGAGAIALSAAIGAVWMLSLPATPPATVPRAIAREEADAMVNALKPRRQGRPLIAVIGINDATEVTDYLMPYGVIQRSGVADVVLVATQPGPVKLYPALTVEPHATVTEFDAQHPRGADYVIVPAMSRDDDPEALEWLKQQASNGALIIGVCAGAKVVAEAGLLDGKRATTHWYYLEEMLDRHPAIHYVPDRRIVVDGDVATTTGVTASMPSALTLVEAIAGREKAEAVARGIGLVDWDASHDSGAFIFTRPFAWAALVNTVAFWKREERGLELASGIDEVSLALVADAWSRTYRSQATTFAGTPGPYTSRGGVRILPDRITASWPAEGRLPPVGDRQPARALEEALERISARYGSRTAYLVAMQLEYPMRPGAPWSAATAVDSSSGAISIQPN